MRLLFLVAAWVAGLLLGLHVQPPLLFLLPLLLAAGAVVLLLRSLRNPIWPALLALVLLLGLIRGGLAEDAPVLVPTERGQATRVKGVVVSDPEAKGRVVQFVLRTSEVDQGSGWNEASDKVLVSARPTRELLLKRGERPFHYGDRLLLEGRLVEPPVFEGFDYRDYLARQGVHMTLAFPATVELLAENQGSPLLARLSDLRFEMSQALRDSLPEPQASLAQTLLLGQRGSLPPSLKEDFRNTGTSHLLAISGLHVGILLMLSLGVSAYLLGRRGQYYLLTPLVLIWVYALLSGLSPSALRAAIMGSVFLAALALGRPRSALPALALAAGVMAGVSPQMLRELSFQLSFAAVAGIALLAFPLADWVRGRLGAITLAGNTWLVAPLQWVVLSVVVSVAATVATLPLIAFNFHQAPTLGIPATVLSLPALPFILGASLITVVATFIHPTLGQVFGWVAWVPITYLVELVQLVGLAPGSVISVPRFSGLLVWAYYGVLALAILAPAPLKLLARGVSAGNVRGVGGRLAPSGVGVLVPGLVLAVFAAIAWSQAYSGPDGRLHVLFLDVGQGDAILIVTPKGRQIMVDGGPDPSRASLALDSHLSFWDRSLDLAVATHADEDHLRGLVEVVRRYSVDTVLEGMSDDSALYLEWQLALEDKGLEPGSLYRGQVIDLGEPVLLEVVNPPADSLRNTPSNRNDNSVVLRLTYGKVSFLLTADIEARAEEALLREYGYLGSTVLKVAHHGSRTSTTAAFLSEVSPQVAVIQAGANNPHGHPHQEVVDRLEDVLVEGHIYSTARHGTVELTTDGRSLWVKTER